MSQITEETQASGIAPAPKKVVRLKKAGPLYVSTTNACKLCKPLGATLAYKGVEGCVPFLHGSQGCATYMRRYIISHFREPMDIASSSLGEKQAIHGGAANLKKGLLTVMDKYDAAMVGVASTCLTETIGDDMPGIVRDFKKEFADLNLAHVVTVSTASYSGSHMEGFHAAVRAMVEQLGEEGGESHDRFAIFPGFVSCADIRYLKEVCEDFEAPVAILPDYSETLDGTALEDYEKLPKGGTPIAHIKAMPKGKAAIEFGRGLAHVPSAGKSLAEKGVPLHSLGLPIGLRESDAFFDALEAVTGRPTPEKHIKERGRLVDAFVDGHKYLSGKTCIIYGEEDMCVAMTAFALEIGLRPLLVAGGGDSGFFEEAVKEVSCGLAAELPQVRPGVDFFDIAEEARELKPDLFIGHSKGYKLARELNVPLIRVGFPIHDRFGGQRLLHLGYRGAQNLFDIIVNAVIEKKQSDSDIGWGYL